jgi:hypothetical protein
LFAAWATLPRAHVRREGVVAWLIGVLTTAGPFIADRSWESLDDPAWAGAFRVIDMCGIASIGLAVGFCVFGILLRRLALMAAPLVLLAAAIPPTLGGYSSAVLWWLGAAVATLWTVTAAARSWHQVDAVRRLAQISLTGRTLAIGPNAIRAGNREIRRGLFRLLLFLAAACIGWVIALGMLPGELGRTYEDLGRESPSSGFATAAIAASILTVGVKTRLRCRQFRRGCVLGLRAAFPLSQWLLIAVSGLGASAASA